MSQAAPRQPSPAIVDAPFGKGRTMWVTSTADKSWNEFPVWRDFVVFLYESIYYLVGFRLRSDNLLVGEEFSYVYDSRDYASEVLLRVPARPSSEIVLRRPSPRPVKSHTRPSCPPSRWQLAQLM